MDIVTIDFETYYDKDYSLSKMTTESYVRDSRFEIIGVGIKVNDNPTDWYSGSNFGGFLNSLDYSKRAILCHNTAFDGAVLSWHFGIKPRLWLDTLSMARPLHGITSRLSLNDLAQRYGIGVKGTAVHDAIGVHRRDFTPEQLAVYAEYCVNDVDLTKSLFDRLKLGYPVQELIIIDQTLRMFIEPVIEIDSNMLVEHLAEVQQSKNSLLQAVSDAGATEEATKAMLLSNNKFAEYLKSLDVVPPTKVSPRTGKTTWAFAKTDSDLATLLNHPDERVVNAVAARLGVKSTLEETRTESLMGIAERGRLPIMLHYYGAKTGRFSGGDSLNLQNLPKRKGKRLRQALIAPEGHAIIACDLSQIEARMLAWLAGQDDLVEAFRHGRDVYSEFSSGVYGRPVTKEDKDLRFIGKVAILSLGYGAGHTSYQDMLRVQGNMRIDDTDSMRIVQIYREKNWKIVQFWNECGNALNHIAYGGSGELRPYLTYDKDGIMMPSGFRIQYPSLRRVSTGYEYAADYRAYRAGNSKNFTKIYSGKVAQNITQALAAYVIRQQMAEIGKHYKVAFQVHDEVIVVVPSDNALADQQAIEQIMSTPPTWAPDLPIACESGIATNYGDV